MVLARHPWLLASVMTVGCGCSDAKRAVQQADASLPIEDAESPRDVSGDAGVAVDAGGDSSPEAAPPDIAADVTAPSTTVSLWNGVDLTEWEGDPAVWRVEGDAIVGSAAEGDVLANTFLIYRVAEFDNFVLRAEVWLGEGGNSGLQYRAARPNPANFRLEGYQADIGDRYWGMIYEEGGRRILAPANVECRSGVATNAWNSYEIVADHSELVHRINGVECARFVEDLAEAPESGRIGLQYHAPGGFEVRLRRVEVTVF